MKRKLLILLLLSPAAVYAGPGYDTVAREVWIAPATVAGVRPLKDIAIQQTTLNSATLRDNIALSMADVLAFNSPVFVKSYGRATLSTVAFRGTSPSHTQVTWNGMRMNSPMLGMTDFSMIPAYFIDAASLLHGTSSVGETGGGLGGLVRLSTGPAREKGFRLQYIQGVGSFRTLDEFLRLGYGGDRWQFSTHAAYQSSPNDFEYRNRDKKENVYDDHHNITGQYYPVERNRSGAYRDLHVLQEAYYDAGAAGSLGLSAWYMDSNRELPLLTTDYGDAAGFDNRQRERTLRAVASWDFTRKRWDTRARAGYAHTWMAYDYERDKGNGIMETMTRSRSRVNTLYGQADAEYTPHREWMFTAGLSVHQHFVESADKNIIRQQGDRAVVGYDKARMELSGSVSAKWRPVERLGMMAVLRREMSGRDLAPLVPALFVDGTLSEKGNVVARASVSRNYRFPTLNDLYFLPGGNPGLRKESGFTYDAGLSFSAGKEGVRMLSGSATWFDSHIDDWILWLPTTKGFFSPRNIKKVHSYGVELRSDLSVALSGKWALGLGGTFSWTPSVNEGEPTGPDDRSAGKQLPYVPERSATVAGTLTRGSWSLSYRWCYYSERHTMSSNELTLTGHLPPYYMSNVALEKKFGFEWAELSLKGAVNNIFDEEYLSVLSRPMAGINFEFFVGIRPKWNVPRKSRPDK